MFSAVLKDFLRRTEGKQKQTVRALFSSPLGLPALQYKSFASNSQCSYIGSNRRYASTTVEITKLRLQLLCAPFSGSAASRCKPANCAQHNLKTSGGKTISELQLSRFFPCPGQEACLTLSVYHYTHWAGTRTSKSTYSRLHMELFCTVRLVSAAGHEAV